MKRTLSLLLIISLLITGAALFTGCSDEGDKNYPVTVGSVTIEAEPKNIVVLDDSFADIISYMGYDRKMVARSDECDQDFLSIFPSLGRADSVTADAVAGYSADLVIAGSTVSDALRSGLEANGITLVTLNRATDLSSLKELYITLGTVLSGNTTGRKKGESTYNTLIDRLGQYKSAPTGIPKTAVYLYLDDNGQLCTLTKGSFEQTIFGFNGAINTLSNQEKPPVVFSELRMGSPGFIFYDDEAVLRFMREDETLSTLPSLRRNSVCRIPLKDFYRLGTTCEQIIYDMSTFLENGAPVIPATPDEATPDEPTEELSFDDDSAGSDDNSYDDSYDNSDDSGDGD